MKKIAFAILYLLSLYLTDDTLIQKNLLQRYLAGGDAKAKAYRLSCIVMWLRHHCTFIEHIKATNQLKDEEKKYLSALIWSDLRLYRKAWSELQSVRTKQDHIEQLKEYVAAAIKQMETPPSKEWLPLIQDAIENKRFRTALNLIFEAYQDGERSTALRSQLLQTLRCVRLKRKDLMNLLPMIEEAFLDLFAYDMLQLIARSSSLRQVYQFIPESQWTKGNMIDIIRIGQELGHHQRKSFYRQIIKRLLQNNGPLPLTSTVVNQLNKALGNDLNFVYLCIRWWLEQGDEKEVQSLLNQLNNKGQIKALLYISRYYFERRKFTRALEFAEQAAQIAQDNLLVLIRLIRCHHVLGNITERFKYLQLLRRWHGLLLEKEYQLAKDEKRLLQQKWAYTDSVQQISRDNDSFLVVHVLNKSWPVINGYTIRSREIILQQREMGWNPVVVTKLGWPEEKNYYGIKTERYEGIDHYRLYSKKGRIVLNQTPMITYFDVYAETFKDLMTQIKPRVIHAASNFQNALPALEIARKLGIPSVYEVRGMWHDTQSSKTPGFYGSERYLLHQKYEIYCCQIADRVVTISESLRQHLVKLGVERDKIFVVPNGVDTQRFVPRPPNQELMKRYGLEGKLVFGFIGSVTPYEGLDLFLYALGKLKKVRDDIKVLIVGEGTEVPALKSLSHEMNLQDVVEFVGKIPHEQVVDYYSVIDVFPFPRTRDKVCELVTPLKPYEAMAMGKLVLVSDIPALREIVQPNITGLVFEAENVDSLFSALKKSEQFLHLGQQSRQWVVEERDWSRLVERYKDIYSF